MNMSISTSTSTSMSTRMLGVIMVSSNSENVNDVIFDCEVISFNKNMNLKS